MDPFSSAPLVASLLGCGGIVVALPFLSSLGGTVDARRTLVAGGVETVREGIEKLSYSGLTLSEPVRLRLASHLTLLLCAGEGGESRSTVVSRQRHA